MKRVLIVSICALLLAPTPSVAEQPPSLPVYEFDEAVVYFGEGSAETPASDGRIWSHIASFVVPSPPSWVLVRSHADTVGSPGDNLALSVRRGEAVAEGLVRIGVDPAVITIFACGEARPAVGTGDEISEPLNRRATVEWGDGERGRQEDPSCRTFAFEPGKGASAAP